MLVLARQRDESIEIDGGRIIVTVVDIRGDKVRLGVQAAKDIPVHRLEVAQAMRGEQPKPKPIEIDLANCQHYGELRTLDHACRSAEMVETVNAVAGDKNASAGRKE